MEQTFLALPGAKAAGYDGLTGELLKLHAPASARAMIAVYAKSAIGICEPVEFRGGALIPLAKRASAIMACENFRSVLVSSVAGKAYHKQLRNRLVPLLGKVKGDMQAGAMPGISTEAVAMAARAFRGLMVAKKQAWALTFFDVKAAYYRVLRQALVQVGDSEKAVRRLFHDLGVPSEALAELVQKFNTLGEIAQAGASDHMCHLVSDLLQGTWFRMDAGLALTATHRGVRPGDGLADVLFGFSFSAYVAAAEAALAKRGLLMEMPGCGIQPPWEGHEPASTISCCSWADDFAQLSARPRQASILLRVQQVVQCFVEQAEVAGIRLTFAPDKTATMVEVVESCDLHRVTRDSKGVFMEIISAVTSQQFRLPLVEVYKHLGGIVASSGSPAPEISYRHSLALTSLRPLKAKLFANAAVPLPVRRHLMRSLVVSRFVFGSAALDLTAGMHKRQWAQHYVALWRSLWKRSKGDPALHGYEVLRRAEAPTPPLALALARAVFLRQIVAGGPATLLHLLLCHWEAAPKASWFGLVVGDVQIVTQYVPGAGVALGTVDPLRSLLESVSVEPDWWVRHVKGAVRQVQRDLQAWAKNYQPRQSCGQERRAVAVEQFEPGSEPEVFRCPWCPSGFPLRKHLGVHMARAHGVFSPARHLAFGCVCISCLKCYHTPSRLQFHLKRSDRCLRRSCLLAPPLSLQEVREVEADEVKAKKRIKAGLWQTYSAAAPAVQAEGPMAVTADERLDMCGEDMDLATPSRLFRPCGVFLSWVDRFTAERSREGPRQGTASFWDVRPCFT